MMICRDLANSIEDESPYAWKLYYTGEAATYLSEKLMKVLELVMKRVEKSEERRRASKKLDFKPPLPFGDSPKPNSRSRGKGEKCGSSE